MPTNPRLKPLPRGVDLELGVLVFTRSEAVYELVAHAAPRGVGVFAASDVEGLRLEMAAHFVLVAVVVDMELDAFRRRALFDAVEQRWLQPPTVAILRSSSPNALAAADEHTGPRVFFAHPQGSARLASFLRVALGGRLRWIVRLLERVSRKDVTDASLETLLAHCVCQVHRHELPAALGISERAVQKRVRSLCRAFGLPDGSNLSHVARLVATPCAEEEIPASVLADLERRLLG